MIKEGIKRKRPIVFILVFLLWCTLLPASVQAASDPANLIFDISEGDIIIDDPGGVLTVRYGPGTDEPFTAGEEITIIGTTTEYIVDVRVSANITLQAVNIDVSTVEGHCAFSMSDVGTAVNLTLSGDNTLISGSGAAGLHVADGAALTIGGTGSLTATGGDGGAGLGGHTLHTGSITINNGTIAATGGVDGAGIGGGRNGHGSNITITGGDVTARAGASGGGAGIGGGDGGHGTNILIEGGAVDATGGNGGGAGIGGGDGGYGAGIRIRGGSVSANGRNGGAGIGGGVSGSGTHIFIESGTVNAVSIGTGGAGIGGGNSGGGGGSITISGGRVTASGGTGGAGIGGGREGLGGGEVVTMDLGDTLGDILLGGITGIINAIQNAIEVIDSGGAGDSPIVFTGGTVRATGGLNADDIGDGSDAERGEGTMGLILISGGSIDGDVGYPAYNGSQNGNETVYSTEIKLEDLDGGSPADEAVVSMATISYYSMNDMRTDGSGQLYLWLPQNTTTTQVEASGTIYRGRVVTPGGAISAVFTEVEGIVTGRDIVMRYDEDSGYIQWQYVGEEAWQNLIAIADLMGSDGARGVTGPEGRKIELQSIDGHIRWRYDGDETWKSLVSLSTMKGETGATGAMGATGAQGAKGEDGNGIAGITKTGTIDNVDIYTIVLTDGTQTTFNVTNGKNGVGIADGKIDDSGNLVLTLTDGTVLNLGGIVPESVPVSVPAPGRDGIDPLALIALIIAIIALIIAVLTLLAHLGVVNVEKEQGVPGSTAVAPKKKNRPKKN